MDELTPAAVLAGVETWVNAQFEAAQLKVEVKLHGGRFSVADLEKYATSTRACRVALEGLKFEVTGRGDLVCSAHVVLVALAGDLGKAGTRALNVLQVLTPIQAAAPGSKLDLALQDSINAKDIKAANLYHAALDQKGTAAWVITWPVQFKHPRVR